MGGQAVLTALNLSKNYGSLKAVDSVSFSVNRGEIFGFLGPNGAGKTTTIKMLAGLLKPDAGSVTAAGTIGMCPQDIVVWEGLTCLEQLKFMAEMHNIKPAIAASKAMELLLAMGLMEKKDKLAGTLSGGMQRRLNVALALVHFPDIVILDEPQAGLDPQSRVLVRDYIRSLKKKATVILTTHDMEEAEKLSDRVCIIDRGRILCCGTVDELRDTAGGGDIYEMEIEGSAAKLVPGLKKIKGISGIKAAGNTVTFISAGGKALEPALFAAKKKKAKIVNFRMRETSLEDVFIGLTGRGLRE